MPAIVVEGLIKSFRVPVRRPGAWGALTSLVRREHRTVQALRGISFQLEPSEIVGYIGPNGAGKSTTIKILSGILVPDGGTCEVDGVTPWRERVRRVRNIGVVFGQRTQLWWDLPVAESFDLLREIYRVPPAEHRRTRDELVAALGLANLLNVPVRQLSLGQRMRCDLAASLLHRPRVLFLDEPTIGLDAEAKLALRDHIKTINRDRGVTVILTTHDLADIEALCRRVLVIHEGALLLDGTLDDLRRRVTSERRLLVDLADAREEVRDPDARVVARDGHRVELAFDPERVPAATLIARLAAAHPVRDLFVVPPPIEEIVAKLYRDLRR